MDKDELGIDRTVVTSWAPDDAWPAAYDLDDAAIAGEAPGPDLGDPVSLPPGFTLVDDGSTGSSEGGAFEPSNVEAVANVGGHPLHPLVVPLPIGSFVGAFLADLAYVRTGDRFWARSAQVLTATGVATGLLAGALGAMDFTGRREVRSHASAWAHAGGNLTVVGLGVLSTALRARDPRRAVSHGGLAISAASAALLGVTGWLGGELTFRQRIGVTSRA